MISVRVVRACCQPSSNSYMENKTFDCLNWSMSMHWDSLRLQCVAVG